MNALSRKRVAALIAVFILLLSGCAGLTQFGAAPQPAVQLSTESEAPAETAATTREESAVVENNSPAVNSAPLNSSTVANFDAVLAQQQAFIDVYQRVNPAVVNIDTNAGQGSGFVYDANGYIVTNNHVVAGARQVFVTFSNGTQLAASLVGTDPGADLAVLKVDPTAVNLTPVTLADSDALQVGQLVVAIGSPFGLESSMSTGIISGLNRLFPGAVGPGGTPFQIPNIIQTDAAINPGNSGGPLLDIYGNVIGVNTAIQSAVRSSSGVGYAVPANIVNVVVPQLIENGRVATPWLGIAGLELTPTVAEELGLPTSQQGILISEVVAGGPAAAAGLQAADPATGLGGDVIISVDGQPIAAFDDLLGYVVEDTRVGQTIQLEVLRGGETVTVPLTLQERP